MNFRSASDAAGFADAIRPVCPCKANPPTATGSGMPERAATMASTSAGTNPKTPAPATKDAKGTMPPPAKVPARNAPTVLARAATMQLEPTTASLRMPAPHQQVTNSTVPNGAPQSHSIPNLARSATYTPQTSIATAVVQESRAPPYIAAWKELESSAHVGTGAASGPRLPISMLVDQSTSSPEIHSRAETSTHSVNPACDNISGNMFPSAAPDTLYPAPTLAGAAPASVPPVVAPVSAAAPLVNHANPILPASFVTQEPSTSDPAAPDVSTCNPRTDAFLESLREVPPLYDLPRAELESLVAQVVREEGFLQLVSSPPSEAIGIAADSLDVDR